jgi:hypothetical protein
MAHGKSGVTASDLELSNTLVQNALFSQSKVHTP